MLSDQIPKTIDELEEIIIKNRGITDLKMFLKPPHPSTISLSEVGIDEAQYELAIARINQAKKAQENVLIFGDYDADGICATAILWRVLHDHGLKVTPFIPLRDRHGYGVSIGAFEDIEAESGLPDLVITVDNGIVAHEALTYLQEKGVAVILTDHHQPEKNAAGEAFYPPATAVVHSTKLCGATVAWMLARGVSEELAQGQLDLTAIATIADQVSLLAQNRSFAVHGLKALRTSSRLGLKALCEQSKIRQKSISETSIGFGLAPRINAMGRLAHGMDALRLLCTESTAQSQELAQLLADTNQERQELTADLVTLADEQAQLQINQRLVIVHHESFHEGVVGLIAGRLAEQYSKPAIAMSVGAESTKASARSVSGVNIVELLREVRDDLLEVGGHPLAAGFGVETAKIELIKERLFALASLRITQEQLETGLELDCQLPADFLTEAAYTALKAFEPYGQANPRPVFQLDGLKVLDAVTVGNGARHLKLTVHAPDASDPQLAVTPIVALWWRQGDRLSEFKKGQTISLAAELDLNIWKGRRQVQLLVRDAEF